MAHNFEEKDLDLLDKSMRLRERMMDVIARKKDEELPIKPSEIMAVTNLLESVDRSIFSKAKINIDDSSVKNEQLTKEVLKQLMTDLHVNKPVFNQVTTDGAPPVYESKRDFDVKDGELILGDDITSVREDI